MNTENQCSDSLAGLMAQLNESKAELDKILACGEHDSHVDDLRQFIANLGAELQSRRRCELEQTLEFGETVVMRTSVSEGYRDLALHDARRRNLEAWARELGVPLSLPPGIDLSIDDVYDDIQTDLYSLGEHLKALRERQRKSEGSLQGMDSVDRLIEALRRAIASGKIDDAIGRELGKLLDPDMLKWLPLIIGLGMGLGALGGAGAVMALLLAYGPIIWDLIKVIRLIINAETEAEFAKAVEALTDFLGAAGAEIILTIGGNLTGRALKGVWGRIKPGKKPGAAPRKSGGHRRGPSRPRPSLDLPPSVERKRPPWHGPKRVAETPTRPLSPDGHYNPRHLPPEPGSAFSNPSNRQIFREQGYPDTIFGYPNAGAAIDTSGRIIYPKKLRDVALGRRPPRINDYNWELKRGEWTRIRNHETAHRRLRPYGYPPAERSALAKRVGKLLSHSHIVKTLDEAYAGAAEVGRTNPAGFLESLHSFLNTGLRHRYNVDRYRALRELVILMREPWFRRAVDNLDDTLRRLDEGDFDFVELIKGLESFYRRLERQDLIEALRRIAQQSG